MIVARLAIPAAVLALGAFGYLAAGTHADPLPIPTVPAQTVVVTRTVAARWHGRTARAWGLYGAQQHADSVKRGRSLARIRRAARADATSSIYGTIRAFLCIHGGEGSWTDPNPPYWGGVQMDMQFQRTYGSWALRRYHGTANRWPPEVQLVVALTAYYSGRGFYPWPMTARACGLI